MRSEKIGEYEVEYAGSNKATTLLWSVGAEVESIARKLKDKGVVFEHYDMPGLTLKGDVYDDGGKMQVAWFKDPDGNILSITN
jgi:hypothetical protein